MGFVFLISLGFQFVDVIAAITSKLFLTRPLLGQMHE